MCVLCECVVCVICLCVRACVSVFNMPCCDRSVAIRRPGPSSTRRTVVEVTRPSTNIIIGIYT